ncbi:MAG: hypothetical protein WC716_16550 [Chitinophagaceae bacterium]|jgi:hypothetical protein
MAKSKTARKLNIMENTDYNEIMKIRSRNSIISEIESGKFNKADLQRIGESVLKEYERGKQMANKIPTPSMPVRCNCDD